MDEALDVRIKHLEEAIEKLQAKMSETNKEIFQRLNALESSSAVTGEQYKQIMAELSEQKATLAQIQKVLQDLSNKPVKRYETAVSSVISALFGGFATYLATKFLGGGGNG